MTTDTSYKFDLRPAHKSIIKVIGVGGGGSNAVNWMYNQGIKDVEFVVCNTDAQALRGSPVPNTLQIGNGLTEGLGAGANPEKGRDAAIESQDQIEELLSEGTKMVFITAGMGGGTGTGAAPVIAKIAKDLGILTVGIVTAPFGFEGRKKTQQAMLGISELRANCDTVIVILNDKLREIFGNLPISQAFAQADNVLTTAAKGIAEIITVPGYVNVDFEDVKTVMRNSGAAVMGSAQTSGENRALRAAQDALASPLLNDRDIMGAKKILLSIISGEKAELQMDELSEITEFIQEKAGDAAEVIFGHGIDSTLNENIRVTVIATGFDQPREETPEARTVVDLHSKRPVSAFGAPISDARAAERRPASPPPAAPRRIFSRPHEETPEGPPPQEGFDDFEVTDLPGEEAPSQRAESDQQRAEKARLAEAKAHRQRLEKQLQERRNRFRGASREQFDQQLLEVPTYQRRNVRLVSVPPSSDSNVSRYSLTDEPDMLGGNRFLHDNVD